MRIAKCGLYITEGGWEAVVCSDPVGLSSITVYHNNEGGVLYTHDSKSGRVTSRTVGYAYDLKYRVSQD
jgi:hypothetical protein